MAGLGPDETIPNRVPDALRALHAAWLARAADPLDCLEDNPDYAQECEIVASEFLACAKRIDLRIEADIER